MPPPIALPPESEAVLPAELVPAWPGTPALPLTPPEFAPPLATAPAAPAVALPPLVSVLPPLLVRPPLAIDAPPLLAFCPAVFVGTSPEDGLHASQVKGSRASA